MATIDILLATYNGARYLPEQLLSLETQTFTDWRLIVRDDGSTDGSLAIVEEWAAGCGAELRVLGDGRKGLGACGNFGALLEASDAPYFALCDQDDVWFPEKLALMHAALKAAADRLGSDTPLLAYSDLCVVDAELREIHRSFRDYTAQQALQPERILQKLMIQNVVTGCASLGNATLLRAALPIPTEAVMHDWWLALVAAAAGELIDIPVATIQYRQHGANNIGAKKWTHWSMLHRFVTDPVSTVRRAKSIIDRTQKQAMAFHQRFAGVLDKCSSDMLEKYARLHERPIWERKAFLFRSKLWSRSFLRNISLAITI